MNMRFKLCIGLLSISLLCCGPNAEEKVASEKSSLDSVSEFEQSAGSKITITYCCSNHLGSQHCGTQDELNELYNKFGCTGFN